MMKHKKFSLIVGLRAIGKINFVRFNLKKIEIAKEMFVKDIEHGKEVFIPAEMS